MGFTMHKEFRGWIEFLGIEEPFELLLLHGDEKSRRYYRLEKEAKRFVVVDASDEKECVPLFIGVGMRLKETEVLTPLVRSFELHKGFMLLDDVGSTHLLDKCGNTGAASYYERAISTLVEMQKAPSKDLKGFEQIELIEEMNFMLEWYLKAFLNKEVACAEGRRVLGMFMLIAKAFLNQPQETFVHKDFHSRNIMIDANDALVLIDFQDAKVGPMTYDLVSLLRDPYVALDRRELKRLLKRYKEEKGLSIDDEAFTRAFDFTALQRNIMLLGKFAQQYVEEKNHEAMEHIPLLVQYIIDTASNYVELSELVTLLTPQEEDSVGFCL